MCVDQNITSRVTIFTVLRGNETNWTVCFSFGVVHTICFGCEYYLNLAPCLRYIAVAKQDRNISNRSIPPASVHSAGTTRSRAGDLRSEKIVHFV